MTGPTRFRADQNSSLLDLILVNDEDLISDINCLPPFGKSDHLTLESKIQFTTSKKTNIVRRMIKSIDCDSSLNNIPKIEEIMLRGCEHIQPHFF